MKHLGNCPINEFMAQAMKFRGPFIEWVKATGADEIRQRMSDSMGDNPEEKEIAEAFNDMIAEIEDACLEKCPELTAEVLRIATFTDSPDDEVLTMTEYENAAIEMYLNRNLRNFFSRYLRQSRKTSSKA